MQRTELLDDIAGRLAALEGDAPPPAEAARLAPSFTWDRVHFADPHGQQPVGITFGRVLIDVAKASEAAVKAGAYAALGPALEARSRQAADAVTASGTLPRLRRLTGQCAETRAALDAATRRAEQAAAGAQAALSKGDDPATHEQDRRAARQEVEDLTSRLAVLRAMHAQARGAALRAVAGAVTAAREDVLAEADARESAAWAQLSAAVAGPLSEALAAAVQAHEVLNGPWAGELQTGLESQLGEPDPAGPAQSAGATALVG